MSDNTQLSAGAGGDLIATDDIGGVKYQRVKITLGGDGVDDGDASSSNPLPTADATAQATLAAIQALSDTMLYYVTAMLEKMPRLDKTDRVTADLTDYGIGGNAFSSSYINAVSNPITGQVVYRSFEPWNFSDVGSARIYQQITVGP